VWPHSLSFSVSPVSISLSTNIIIIIIIITESLFSPLNSKLKKKPTKIPKSKEEEMKKREKGSKHRTGL